MNKYAFGAAVAMAVAIVLLMSLVPTSAPVTIYYYLALLFLYGAGGYLASAKTRRLMNGAWGGALLALLSACLPWLAGMVLDSGFRQTVGVNSLPLLLVLILAGALLGVVGAVVRKLRLD